LYHAATSMIPNGANAVNEEDPERDRAEEEEAFDL
jgi:hypothetical protein